MPKSQEITRRNVLAGGLGAALANWFGFPKFALAEPAPPEDNPALVRDDTPGGGVYLVTKPIPAVGARAGDRIIVRSTHSAMHRYLRSDLDIAAMARSGSVEREGDVHEWHRLEPSPV